jgi:CRISPR-associated protein Cmr5
MQNLEQIRAASALVVAKETTKADVNKLPALILANGLLATAAFADENEGKNEGKKRPKMAVVVKGLAKHLGEPIFGFKSLVGCETADSLIKSLSQKADYTELQRATVEALAFIGYVKRFAQKGENEY